MECLLGQYIVAVPLVFKPFRDVQVAGEEVRDVVDAHTMPGPHRQVGPESGRVAHSASVVVVVVQAQQAVLEDVVVPTLGIDVVGCASSPRLSSRRSLAYAK